MTKMSARKLVDELAGIGQEIYDRAQMEAREYVAREIEGRFLGWPGQDRRAHADRHPDDCLFEELTENPKLQVAALREITERFERDGVSADFRAGVLFAVRLLADPDFDY